MSHDHQHQPNSESPPRSPSLSADWPPTYTRPPALICDIDETIATEFDVPILLAVGVLQAIHRPRLTVYYVTARPESTRPATERFLAEHRLPGWNRVHYCPTWQSSRQHKRDAHAKIAMEHWVLASIGDSDEEAHAAAATKIPFLRVEYGNPESAWQELERMLGQLGLLRQDEDDDPFTIP
ncbi:HAD family hydrolase [Tuwongella immobilis]|uniref:Uncharacterized protein n=1 Tax=Tuwongella immobilis TaxID=692036 RepID=A0A6C2YI13_9BACT|nr:hypothetical protein [Tuwongella immobilis]VIP00632.1 unnamed protein product [Tuwongella immobilis]VTR96682.1 unnamed protein product [Tuwongella immobilis]